jgi:hypothetical protein
MAKQQDQTNGTDLSARAKKLGVGTTEIKVSRETQLSIAQHLLNEVEAGIHELRSRARLKMLIAGDAREVTILLDSIEKTLKARDALADEIIELTK